MRLPLRFAPHPTRPRSSALHALVGLCLVFGCTNELDLGRRPDVGPSDVPRIDAPMVDCNGVVAAGFALCSTEATRCGLLFLDGTGCLEACRRSGLACVETYDSIEDVCTEDLTAPLGCVDTGHDSDLCICGAAP